MGAYINNALIGDEKVVYEAKVSLWSLFPKIAFGLCLLPFWGIGLLFWISALIDYMTTEVAFTNKRVIAKFGFISRRTVELSLSKLESLQVDQGILGRIFDFGTLVVSGAGNPQAPIPGISEPMKFRRNLMEFQDTQQSAGRSF